MCDHWPSEFAVNGHWYGALEVRRLIRLLNIAVKDRYVGDKAAAK